MMNDKDSIEKKDLNIDPNSTWLNHGIQSLKEVKDWILTQLGWPSLTVELTDSQLNSAISNAMRIFTKYFYTPDKQLILNLRHYKPGVGIDLTEFKVMSVKDISFQRDAVLGYGVDPFFNPYAYFGQGQGGPFFGMGNGNSVGTFTTFHNLNEWFHMAERLTGSNPDFRYNKITKILKIMPEPKNYYSSHHDHYILATCQCEPPLEEIYGEDYFLRLALAEAKIILGTVRRKFANVQLLGGGSIDVDIGNEGKEERDTLIADLQKSESKGQYFCLS